MEAIKYMPVLKEEKVTNIPNAGLPALSNFLIFVQFSGNFGRKIDWRPQFGIGVPPVWEILDRPLYLIASEGGL